MIVFWFLACDNEKNSMYSEQAHSIQNDDSALQNDSAAQPIEIDYVLLPEIQQLNRISMALRGIRPDNEDILLVLDDPSQIDRVVDRYVNEPEFGSTIRDMFAEILQIRAYDITLPPYGAVDTSTVIERNTAMAEEALGLIEHVVLSDRPFHDIVTANQTMLDPVSAKMWAGHTYDFNIGGEQVVTWTDNRPPAGILTTNGMLIRWESNGDNNNRERANMVSTALLCENYATRDIPISGGIDLSDPIAVANAVNETPECIACHQSLDPLAAHFWGFRNRLRPFHVVNAYTNGCSVVNPCYPAEMYYETFEDQHESLGLRPPSYFGKVSSDTQTLGEHIAADPRFALCQAAQIAGYLTQHTHDDIPYERVVELSDVFVDSNYSAKAVAKSVVTHPSFLAQSTNPVEASDAVAGLQIVRPEQYARLLHSLTGFEWIVGISQGPFGDADLLNNDQVGFRMMTGGIDGVNVTTPSHVSTPNRLMMMRAVSLDAAAYVVDKDLSLAPESRILLNAYTGDDEAEIRVLLQDLHRRILLEDLEVDSAEITNSYAFLESALGTSNGQDEALKVLIAAMLQSPDVLFY